MHVPGDTFSHPSVYSALRCALTRVDFQKGLIQ